MNTNRTKCATRLSPFFMALLLGISWPLSVVNAAPIAPSTLPFNAANFEGFTVGTNIGEVNNKRYGPWFVPTNGIVYGVGPISTSYTTTIASAKQEGIGKGNVIKIVSPRVKDAPSAYPLVLRFTQSGTSDVPISSTTPASKYSGETLVDGIMLKIRMYSTADVTNADSAFGIRAQWVNQLDYARNILGDNHTAAYQPLKLPANQWINYSIKIDLKNQRSYWEGTDDKGNSLGSQNTDGVRINSSLNNATKDGFQINSFVIILNQNYPINSKLYISDAKIEKLLIPTKPTVPGWIAPNNFNDTMRSNYFPVTSGTIFSGKVNGIVDTNTGFPSSSIIYKKYSEPEKGSVEVFSNGNFRYTPLNLKYGWDKIKINASANGGEKILDIDIFIGPSIELLDSLLNKIDDSQLILKTQDYNNILNSLSTDKFTKNAYDMIIRDANLLIANNADGSYKEALPNNLNGAKYPLRGKGRLITLGLAYQLTKRNPKQNTELYIKRAKEQLLAYCDKSLCPHWGGSDVYASEIASFVSIGYNMVFEALNENVRATIRQGIVENFLNRKTAYYKSKNDKIALGQGHWYGEGNNFELMRSGAVASSALALLMEPKNTTDNNTAHYRQIALNLLYEYFRFAPGTFMRLGQGGNHYEGLAYFTWSAHVFARGHKCILNAFGGVDFGLDQYHGAEKVVDYLIATLGPRGIFNVGEEGYNFTTNPRYNSLVLWYAKRSNRSDALWQYFNAVGKGVIGNGSISGGDLLFYDRDFFNKAKNSGLTNYNSEYYAPGAEIAYLHTSNPIHDPMEAFAVLKSGQNMDYHQSLALGHVSYDALGVRWFHGIGGDSYSIPNYREKWPVYRKRAEGCNTLVINPNSIGSDQNYAYTDIIDYYSSYESYAITDITSAYQTKADSVIRGIKLNKKNKSLIVQDEIKLKNLKRYDIYSFMHTRIPKNQIELIDNSTVKITSNNKILMMFLRSDGGSAKFEIREAVTFPETENLLWHAQANNSAFRKITVVSNGKQNTTFQVYMIPLNAGEQLPKIEDLPPIVPLDSWFMGDLFNKLGGNLNEGKSVWEKTGSMDILTENPHSGIGSFKVNKDVNYITKKMSKTCKKSVSIWFYDNLTNANVFAFVDKENDRRRGIGVNGNENYVYINGDLSVNTNVKRSQGWHQFKWNYDDAIRLIMSIDDIKIAELEGVYEFNKIQIGDYKMDGKISNVYFDDLIIAE